MTSPGALALAHDVASGLVHEARDHLSRHHRGNDGVEEVLSRLSQPLPAINPHHRPRGQQACRHIPTALRQTRMHYGQLSLAIEKTVPLLRWMRAPEGGSEPTAPGYMDDFAYAEIIGFSGLFSGTDYACGLFVVGPHQHYPEHDHAAPELYWLLSGPADFHFGDGQWVAHDAAGTIWNPSFQPHATHTRKMPMLVFWCWTRDVGGPYRLMGQELKPL